MPQPRLTSIVQDFAPIVAQKVTLEWRAADQIAPLTYAGSLTTLPDNVKKLFAETDKDWKYEIPDQAVVYYSVCETTTHYFVLYAIYHVFDWWKRLPADNLLDLLRDRVDEHAHDMEGALVVVRKDPEPTVDGMVTVSHVNFYLYTEPQVPTGVGKAKPAAGEASRWIVKFNEGVDGNIWLDGAARRIKLFVESRGHGIRGDHAQWGSGEQVWYYRPLGESEKPGALNAPKETRVLGYRLEDFFAPGGVWDHRFGDRVLQQGKDGRWGFVCYQKLTKGQLAPSKANPPWSWNDHNDASPIGEIATDPASFIVRYAQGWGPVSRQYTVNPYLGIG